MFNIIETLQNYFTCKLLPDKLGSKVALHFNINHRWPCLVVSVRRKRYWTASAACVTSFIAIGERIYTLNMCLTEAAPLSDIFVFRHHSDFLTYLFT